MNKTHNDGASSGANNPVFANCPEATIVQEAEAQFAGAVEEFVEWRNQDVKRVTDEVPDTAEHLIEGVRRTLKTGCVLMESVGRFREALQLVEGEMRRHDFRSMNEEQLRAIALPLDHRHQALRALIKRHSRIAGQACQMFDELNARFWHIHGARVSAH